MVRLRTRPTPASRPVEGEAEGSGGPGVASSAWGAGRPSDASGSVCGTGRPEHDATIATSTTTGSFVLIPGQA